MRTALQPAGPGAGVGLLAMLLAYLELVHWSLEGFYDVLMVGPLVLCAELLRRRRWLAALVAFCAAAFLHYRAYFFAPFAVLAAVQLLRERSWRSWGRRDWAAVAAVVVMACASLYTFALLWPTLSSFRITNPVNLFAGTVQWRSITVLALVSLVCAAAFVYARAWLDLAVLGWMLVMWARTPYTYEWYMLLLLGWFGTVVAAHPQRERTVWEARLLFTLFVSVAVCRYVPVPGWLERVLG